MTYDEAWLREVQRVCDPVFAAADVGFVSQVALSEDRVRELLWEADPLRFAERFPDSGIVESYGEQWPATCIDYWVYLEGDRARISFEGWNSVDEFTDLTGDGHVDGAALAREFARILGVELPLES